LLKSDKVTGTSHGGKYTFIFISRSVLLRMINFSVNFVEKMKIHILYLKTFFENRVVYKIV